MSSDRHDLLVSVVVVCHNDGKWLPKCLASIRAQTIFSQLEVIIADNASEDDTPQIAEALISNWPNAIFIRTGGDYGFDVACNRAASKASGKYLYLLNPDTWLETDCLERFCLYLESHHAIAAGGTILEYEDQTTQAIGSDGFDLFGNPVSRKSNQASCELFCIAGFFFIRRDAFNRLGMLDEKFFMYGEEFDLCWRIWISGESLIPAPAARIHHRGAALVNPAGGTRTVENRTSVQKRFLANRNRLLTIARNGQHVLLLMLLPCAGLVCVEGLVTWIQSRSWAVAKAGCFAALVDFWRMRDHLRVERQRIRTLRRRSDFWMLRFLRLRFGRWEEVKKILRFGFPKFR